MENKRNTSHVTSILNLIKLNLYQREFYKNQNVDLNLRIQQFI